jgi:2-methylisocitrate lyase-like PEP mutase family enzyme
MLHFKRYEEMGYSIAIYPPICLTASYVAMKDKLMELRKKGILEEGAHGGISLDELLDFLGLGDYRAFEDELMRKF